MNVLVSLVNSVKTGGMCTFLEVYRLSRLSEGRITPLVTSVFLTGASGSITSPLYNTPARVNQDALVACCPLRQQARSYLHMPMLETGTVIFLSLP